MTTYVTFGQDHLHVIDGVTFDRDCVAVIISNNAQEGRAKAFKTFGAKFCMEYFDDEFNPSMMTFYPRGLININKYSNRKFDGLLNYEQ